jgi:hypothetical protein
MTVLLLAVFGFFGAHSLLWLVHSVRTRARQAKPRHEEDGDAS